MKSWLSNMASFVVVTYRVLQFYALNYTGEAILELDRILLLIDRLVDETLKHGFQSVFRPCDSMLAKRGDQSNQGVFSEAVKVRYSFTRCFRTHGYRSLSKHKAIIPRLGSLPRPGALPIQHDP